MYDVRVQRVWSKIARLSVTNCAAAASASRGVGSICGAHACGVDMLLYGGRERERALSIAQSRARARLLDIYV